MWAPSTSSGNVEGRSTSAPMELYHRLTCDIRVLVIDNDRNSLATITSILESLSYKVTPMEDSVRAFIMLTEKKEHFDLVLTEIHLPLLHGFKIIGKAVQRGMKAISMSRNGDAKTSKEALENGACFNLKKPLNIELLENLWQFVKRDRMVKVNRFGTTRLGITGVYNIETEPNYLKNKDLWKEKVRTRKSSIRNEECNKAKQRSGKKPCKEWTDQLHTKFMAAVNELGEGRCYPKEIQLLMNVPGLTRMQVASHLQKCRNENWRAPETRKQASSSNVSSDSEPAAKLVPRKFGSMPRIINTSTSAQKCRNENWRAPETRKQASSSNVSSDSEPAAKLVPRKFGSMPRIMNTSTSAQSHPKESSENYRGPEMYSPLCNFSGTINEEYPTQPINPQTEVEPQCFGNNMVSPNSGMQNMVLEGYFGTLSDQFLMDYTKNAFEVPASLDGVIEISTENGQANFASLPDMTSQQNPGPIFSEPSNATLTPAAAQTTTPIPNQITDDFFDFLPEMNDPQLLSRLLEDYGQNSQQ